MMQFLLVVLLCSGFYRHTSSTVITHQSPYHLPFMQKFEFSEQSLNRQYTVMDAVKIQCGWNTTLSDAGAFPPTNPQDTLLFDADGNTLTCQPYRAPSSVLPAADLFNLGSNMQFSASVQNGSTSYSFPMQFTDNSSFTLPLNRTILHTTRGPPALVWEVQVFGMVTPPTDDANTYYKNSFSILDPYSDPYYSWDYGDAVDWASVKPATPPSSDHSKVLFTVKSPCAWQVTLFMVTGLDNGVVYIGKSWAKNLEQSDIKWYKTTLVTRGKICKVTGAWGVVRFVILQTDSCGYYVSTSLAPDVFATADYSTAATLAVGARRLAHFTQSNIFGTSSPGGLGDLNNPPGSWCYLRKNIQAGCGDECGSLTAESLDWLSVKDSTTGEWSLVREPLDTGQLISAIKSYKLNASTPLRANSAYSQKLMSNLQTPSNIIYTYVNIPTSTYFILYFNGSTTNLYSQALLDTLNSIPSARLIYNFAVTDDMPKRIVGHPGNTDIFILGDHVAWLRTDNGASVKQIFDIRKFGALIIGSMIFSQNGTISYFTDSTGTHLYRGNSYYGGYIPINQQSTRCQHCALDITKQRLYVDGLGGLHLLSTTGATFTPVSVDSLYLNPASTVSPSPTEKLSGVFSVVPFTRKTFMLVEWAPTIGSPFYSQFSPGDIGRILMQTPVTILDNAALAAADINIQPTPGKAHIVGYGRLDSPDIWTSITPLPAYRPASYIVMEAVVPFVYDADSTLSSATLTIVPGPNTVTFTMSVSVGALTPYSTIFVEQYTDGIVTFRGSFLMLTTTTATALLVKGDTGPTTIVSASQWKEFKLSGPSATDLVASWYLQDFWTCLYEFLANKTTISPWDHHMDRGDKWKLTVQMRKARTGEVRKSKGSFMPNYLLHEAGNPWRLHARSEMLGDGLSGWNVTYEIEEVGSDFNEDNSVTSLSFRMDNPTLGCGVSAGISVTVVSGCMRGASLIYDYPDGPITDKEWVTPNRTNSMGDYLVGPIPVNYRPPSAQGTAFPTTRILYNSDPSKDYLPHFNNHESFVPSYGCDTNHTFDCVPAGTCTDAQRANPQFINCINRTIYLPFPGDHYFQMRRFAQFQDMGTIDVTVPLQLKELNNRTDFVISDSTDPQQQQVLQWLAASPGFQNVTLYYSNTTIRFSGTGLYHFQVQPAKDYSYCGNSVYFTLWLYDAGLPYPMAQVCLCMMGLIVSLWLFPSLTAAGEATLLDYRHYSAVRPPLRIPLRDAYVDVEDWDELDLEAEAAALHPPLTPLPEDEDEGDASKSSVAVA